MSSYPNGNPSRSMSAIWNSGEFTPDNVVVRIIDNVTPVNKNSVRNSIGQEISLIQNYVNSTFLGRSDLAILSGYIQNLISNSGTFIVYNSGYYPTPASPLTMEKSVAITSSGIVIDRDSDTLTRGYNILNSSGLIIYGVRSGGDSRLRNIRLDGEGLVLDGSGPYTEELTNNDWNLSLVPWSGLNIWRLENDGDYPTYGVNVDTSGIYWNFLSYDESNKNITRLNVDSSGNIISFPSGQFVIGSGVPYDNCNLTVGATDGKGDLFVKTHGGGGLLLTGDNGTIDRIYSYGNILYISTEGGINTNNIILNNSNESCTINANTIQDSYTSIIASGEAYDHCALTVGRINQSGDLFVRTSNGGGLHLRGDNASIDRITSYASSHLALENDYSQIIIPASGAITLPANATDTASSYALVNAIKDLLIQRGWAS